MIVTLKIMQDRLCEWHQIQLGCENQQEDYKSVDRSRRTRKFYILSLASRELHYDRVEYVRFRSQRVPAIMRKDVKFPCSA